MLLYIFGSEWRQSTQRAWNQGLKGGGFLHLSKFRIITICIIPIFIRYMGQRKAWNKEEDYALIDIIQVKKIKKWSAVSKALENDYNIFGRTGKQCRQRWHNQLDPAIKNTEWSFQQEKILFHNHNKFGNKWARISQQLEGRTDNCVKNHFYSTLRRSFRRLNRFIADSKQRLFLKQLKPVILSKLVAAAEDKFNRKLKLSTQIIDCSNILKNRLLPFSKDVENTSEDQIQIEKLIKDIIQFSKSYKRKKSKKSKSSQNERDDYQDQQEISIKDQSERQETPVSSYVSSKKQQHQNLFVFSASQVIKQVKETGQTRESRQSFGVFQLNYKPQSKIIEEDHQHSGELEMFKRGSNLSNWSGLIKFPSLHERISEMSNNRLNMNAVCLDGSMNYKNLAGCEFQQLND